MGKFVNLTGIKFNSLTVIGKSETDANGNIKWECLCDCGNSCICYGDNLRRNHTKSCGCLKEKWAKIKLTTHGQSPSIGVSPEYRAWSNMLTRCYNPKNTHYKYYGGGGIIVCERWKNRFVNFFSDMGNRPSKDHSLDRWPNKNGNYEPSNCRWATKHQQANNKNNNVWYTANGETKTQTSWASFFGVTNSAITFHLERGKDFKQIYDYYSNND